MRDDQDIRLWADYRKEINLGIDRVLADVMQAFCVLNRIEWSAPWRKDCG